MTLNLTGRIFIASLLAAGAARLIEHLRTRRGEHELPEWAEQAMRQALANRDWAAFSQVLDRLAPGLDHETKSKAWTGVQKGG